MKFVCIRQNFAIRVKCGTCLRNIYDNEGGLKKNPQTIDGNYKEIFPHAANDGQSIPSIRETVKQCNDVWNK